MFVLCTQGLKHALAQWQGGEGPARTMSLQEENRQLRDALERANHRVRIQTMLLAETLLHALARNLY